MKERKKKPETRALTNWKPRNRIQNEKQKERIFDLQVQGLLRKRWTKISTNRTTDRTTEKSTDQHLALGKLHVEALIFNTEVICKFSFCHIQQFEYHQKYILPTKVHYVTQQVFKRKNPDVSRVRIISRSDNPCHVIGLMINSVL